VRWHAVALLTAFHLRLRHIARDTPGATGEVRDALRVMRVTPRAAAAA